ncbi:acylneuraminate cytidylyltransferase family protein [Maritalea mediterranea]|uniref:Acylneuraminate cytidylyltransferase family protein n=1 Tax=Maritalea mediterranea TaxID=2909667 RepID=A0ABS9E6B5_9HYPH|nr:acylneuraminate cytidylyltransferase family protein [Maritalea mediterranea]MCF4098411.1 acylneuraminate cytidylyltransferase family protein [Maritalea mediterranea]
MKSVAIIPVRSGSKTVPDKNIKHFLNKPLMYWTIGHALEAKHIDRVIVSTDSQSYAELARQYGAEVPFLRPPHLSTDEATTECVMSHCVDFLALEKYKFDYLVLLQVTSPIRSSDLIDQCIEKAQRTNADSLLTVAPDHSFGWYEDDDRLRADYDYENRPRRQDIGRIRLRETGSVYVTSKRQFLSSENRLGGKIKCFQTSFFESLEIDTHEDWVVIESIAKGFYSATGA